MQLRILDVGKTFGYPCAEPLFDPWKPQVVKPSRPQGKFDPSILDNIDLIIFGGGQDICPKMYGHRNVASYCGEEPSDRDIFESEIFNYNIVNKRIPILGICRGAQFLCVMNGGTLIQHVDGHGGVEHEVFLFGDPDRHESMLMNSYHHQMMWPIEYKMMLGYTMDRSKTWKYDALATQHNLEGAEINPEMVLFEHRQLAIQGHPEYLDPMEPFAVKTRKYVKRYLQLGEYK